MTKSAFPLALAAACWPLAACDSQNQAARTRPPRRPRQSRKPPATRPSPPGLDQNGQLLRRGQGRRARRDARRARALHRARPRRRGLRQAAGRRARQLMKPEARAELTGAADLSHPARHDPRRGHRQGDRRRQGQGVLATMGGGTLTATREGDAIVLTDSAGGKATHRQGRREALQRRRPPHRRRADARLSRGLTAITPSARRATPRYNEVRASGRRAMMGQGLIGNEGDDRTGDPPEEPGPCPVGGRAAQHHPDPLQRADRGARRRLAPADGDRPRPAGRRERPRPGQPGRRDHRLRPHLLRHRPQAARRQPGRAVRRRGQDAGRRRPLALQPVDPAARRFPGDRRGRAADPLRASRRRRSARSSTRPASPSPARRRAII